MKRQFKIITSVATHICTINKKNDIFFDVFEREIENMGNADEKFIVENMDGKILFTDTDVKEWENDGGVYICRFCGKRIESEHDVYVEDGASECHCEDCHPILFPNDDVWQALYKKYNIDSETGEERNNFYGEYYYWTTAP